MLTTRYTFISFLVVLYCKSVGRDMITQNMQQQYNKNRFVKLGHEKEKRENIRDDVELGVAAFLSLNGIYGSSRIWIYCAWFYSWYAATPFKERRLYDVLLYARYYKTTRKCITEKNIVLYNENSFSNNCFIILFYNFL